MGKDTIVIKFDYSSTNYAYSELPYKFKDYFSKSYGQCEVLFTFPDISTVKPALNSPCVLVFYFKDPQTANRVKQKYHGRVLFEVRLKNCWLENAQMYELNITDQDLYRRKRHPLTTNPDTSHIASGDSRRHSPSSPRHSRYRRSPSPDTRYRHSPSPDTKYHHSPSPGTRYRRSPSPGTRYRRSPSPGTRYRRSPSPGTRYRRSPSPGTRYRRSPSPDTRHPQRERRRGNEQDNKKRSTSSREEGAESKRRRPSDRESEGTRNFETESGRSWNDPGLDQSGHGSRQDQSGHGSRQAGLDQSGHGSRQDQSGHGSRQAGLDQSGHGSRQAGLDQSGRGSRQDQSGRDTSSQKIDSTKMKNRDPFLKKLTQETVLPEQSTSVAANKSPPASHTPKPCADSTSISPMNNIPKQQQITIKSEFLQQTSSVVSPPTVTPPAAVHPVEVDTHSAYRDETPPPELVEAGQMLVEGDYAEWYKYMHSNPLAMQQYLHYYQSLGPMTSRVDHMTQPHGHMMSGQGHMTQPHGPIMSGQGHMTQPHGPMMSGQGHMMSGQDHMTSRQEYDTPEHNYTIPASNQNDSSSHVPRVQAQQPDTPSLLNASLPRSVLAMAQPMQGGTFPGFVGGGVRPLFPEQPVLLPNPILHHSHTPLLIHPHTTLPHSHTPLLPHSHIPLIAPPHTPPLPHSHPSVKKQMVSVATETTPTYKQAPTEDGTTQTETAIVVVEKHSPRSKSKVLKPRRNVDPKYFGLRKTILQDYKEQVNMMVLSCELLIKSTPSLKPTVLKSLQESVQEMTKRTEDRFWEEVDQLEAASQTNTPPKVTSQAPTQK